MENLFNEKFILLEIDPVVYSTYISADFLQTVVVPVTSLFSNFKCVLPIVMIFERGKIDFFAYRNLFFILFYQFMCLYVDYYFT